MNVIDELLVKTGKEIYYGAYYLQVWYPIRDHELPLNFYLWWCECYFNNGIPFSKTSFPSSNVFLITWSKL